MRVCDICKTKPAKYNACVTVDDEGLTREMELCGLCHRELRYREDRARHQAYEDTVKAMAGEIKIKSHWWDMFSW